MPLVAHDGLIYRVGGLSARNATTKDKEDLHSVTEFASYNPATREWTALKPLPAGRSSHDAVFIENKLYVVGGWTLSGSRKGAWLDDVLVYDVEQPASGWQKVRQPFRRRALAAGNWNGRLIALGGMDQDADISQSVDVFDQTKNSWSKTADVPGEGMAGFGVSAWNIGDKLYVCGCEGVVYRLSDDGDSWEKIAKLAKPRFFHRLLPAGPNKLIVVGGATSDGHIADVELIDVSGSAGVADNSKRKTSL
jgi:N-acetylneuraminic acid mutarotase